MVKLSTTEDRLTLLERKVAELEHQRAMQEDRDIALLARIDNFIDDLRRVERVQMRSFDEIIAHQKDQDVQIATLVAGQQQILEILIGKPPIHD